MRKFYLLSVGIICSLMVGCQSGSNKLSQIDYLPFQESENDNWGMVSTSGEILFAKEFVNEPSVSVNGIFSVKNAAGKYELYKAEAKPTQIGTDAYISVGMFFADVTPAVLEDSHVMLIDRNGKQVAKIDQINGKSVDLVQSFSDGLAIVKTVDNKYGFIDTKGKCVIEPKYDGVIPFNDGLALASIEVDGKSDVILLNKDGKETKLKDVDANDFIASSEGIVLLKDGENITGYDAKGEKIIKLGSKFKNVSGFTNGYAFYSDGDAYGLIDKKGEVVIRAKYKDSGSIYADFVTFDNNDNKVVICDFNGQEIVSTEFKYILPFFNGKEAFARENNKYIFINNKGEEVNKESFHSVGTDMSGDYIYSNYLDVKAIIETGIGKITPTGMLGFEFGVTSQAFIEKFIPTFDVKERQTNNEKWDFDRTNDALSNDVFNSNTVDISRIAMFDKKLLSAITNREYSYGGYYYQDKVVGYKFNDESKVAYIISTIRLSGHAESKAPTLYNAAVNYIKAMGEFVPVEGEDAEMTTEFNSKDGSKSITVDLNNSYVYIRYRQN